MPTILFHSFRMGDVEDPDIYVAQPIYEWQQTEHGQWVMSHCEDPVYNIRPDVSYMGYRVTITGEITDKDATFHQLRWGRYAAV
jgi:hypothetical protein